MDIEITEEFFDKSIDVIERWPTNGYFGFFMSSQGGKYTAEECGGPAVQLSLVQREPFKTTKFLEYLENFDEKKEGFKVIRDSQKLISVKFADYINKNKDIKKECSFDYYLNLSSSKGHNILIGFFDSWKEEFLNQEKGKVAKD